MTSAAIACGLEALGIAKRPSDMPSLQAAASVGQSVLSAAYANAFAAHGMTTSVVLLTRRDTADRTAYLHARDTLGRLLELGVVPVVNENDTVSVEQICFGDNDTLAALVACLIDANLMVILSDIDGLYDANPRRDESARLIEVVERIDRDVMSVAGEAGSTVGSGGMITKIKAARVLMAAGIPMVICHGRRANVIVDVAAGKSAGTLFVARARKLTRSRRASSGSPRRRRRARCGGHRRGRSRGARQQGEARFSAWGSRASRVASTPTTSSTSKTPRASWSRGQGRVLERRGRARLRSVREELERNRLLAPLAERARSSHRDELIVFE